MNPPKLKRKVSQDTYEKLQSVSENLNRLRGLIIALDALSYAHEDPSPLSDATLSVFPLMTELVQESLNTLNTVEPVSL